MIPFSVLDLSPIAEGQQAADALCNTLDLARHAEALGFHRYWLAEHHNMPGIASAATAVVINHVAAGTRTIRVGSGGIMLPNHAPLVIAEQFGTLAALHPGRIDLGLGRAPGSDGATTRALRRDPMAAEQFPRDVMELQQWFQPARPDQAVQAVPGAGLDVPIILLGSSLFSAQLAAMLGLPFAFAAHFAPDALAAALEIYRSRFEPSAAQPRPHAIVGVAVYAAESDAAARRLATSAQLQFLALRRGRPGKLPAPVDDMDALWTPAEQRMVDHAMAEAVIGGPDTVCAGLDALIRRTGADELIVAAQIHDHAARKRSYTLVAEARETLAAARPAGRAA